MAGSFLIDDLDAILNTDDFAVVGEFFPTGKPSRTIKGIFDDEDVEVDADGRVVYVRSARFQVKTSECVQEGERIVIAPEPLITNGGDFLVALVQNDGTGMTTLHLEQREVPNAV